MRSLLTRATEQPAHRSAGDSSRSGLGSTLRWARSSAPVDSSRKRWRPATPAVANSWGQSPQARLRRAARLYILLFASSAVVCGHEYRIFGQIMTFAAMSLPALDRSAATSLRIGRRLAERCGHGSARYGRDRPVSLWPPTRQSVPRYTFWARHRRADRRLSVGLETWGRSGRPSLARAAASGRAGTVRGQPTTAGRDAAKLG